MTFTDAVEAEFWIEVYGKVLPYSIHTVEAAKRADEAVEELRKRRSARKLTAEDEWHRRGGFSESAALSHQLADRALADGFCNCEICLKDRAERVAADVEKSAHTSQDRRECACDSCRVWRAAKMLAEERRERMKKIPKKSGGGNGTSIGYRVEARVKDRPGSDPEPILLADGKTLLGPFWKELHFVESDNPAGVPTGAPWNEAARHDLLPYASAVALAWTTIAQNTRFSSPVECRLVRHAVKYSYEVERAGVVDGLVIGDVWPNDMVIVPDADPPAEPATEKPGSDTPATKAPKPQPAPHNHSLCSCAECSAWRAAEMRRAGNHE